MLAQAAVAEGGGGAGHRVQHRLQLARTLEQRLRVLQTFESVAAADWQDWLEELDRFIGDARRDPKSLT